MACSVREPISDSKEKIAFAALKYQEKTIFGGFIHVYNRLCHCYGGVALCVLLCGIGSSIGLYKTGSAAAGVLSESPKKFGKLMVLVLLPATQGLYGFIVALSASNKLGMDMNTAQGWAIFGAVMPIALAGFDYGYLSGKIVRQLYLCGR